MAGIKRGAAAGANKGSGKNGHEIACLASRRLCELFGERLRMLALEVQRTPTSTWCGHSLVDATKPIAWVNHTKRKGSITVWIRRSASDPMRLGGSTLPFKTRSTEYKGPFQWYGHHVQIASIWQLDELFEVMIGNDVCGAFLDRVESDPATLMYPEELPDTEEYREGIGKRVLVNRYERSSSARQACLKHFGPLCVVCGMSFGEVYGPEFSGIMHVHHLNPRCGASGDVMVSPIDDLRPVCPNCHTVIHSRQPCYSIEEVRSILNKNK
ncbi:MAG: hypothetical protein SF028_07920 [Candidatus Sumerlaeia bacterium]|nr:hypothetical protein [Candidatus Sumerlaeia bacterium]